MTSPNKTIEHFQRLCAINQDFQEVAWLRQATSIPVEHGDCWSVVQEGSRIELHVGQSEALLLLWIPDNPPPPMDNIKPQWDSTLFVQNILAKCDTFPYGISWASQIKNEKWSTIWLATQWWPQEGQTDAVDNPERWIQWWWTTIMEFTTPAPSLYDVPSLSN